MRHVSFAILAMSLFASGAHADICLSMSGSQARQALSLLPVGTLIEGLEGAAWDLHPGQSQTSVNRIEALRNSQGGEATHSVKINGREVDLGKVRLVLNTNARLNVARLLDCGSEHTTHVISEAP